MADVTLTYNGQNILEMSASGTKTLKAAGKICKTDIEVAYVKSGGGGSGNNILKGSSPPSAGIGQDGDVYLQYNAVDDEIVSSFVKVSGAWQALVGSDVDDVTDSGLYTGVEAPPPASLGSDGDYYYQRTILARSIKSVNSSSIEGSYTSAYGVEFTVTEPVTVTHLFAKTKNLRTGKLQIGTTSQILAETESVLFPANEWVELPLASPIQLSPGTNYVVKAVVTVIQGTVAYVRSISNLTYDSKFTYVRARYDTSWPGSAESGICPLVGISYLTNDGVYKIRKQFYKSSGSWSEIT